MTYTECSEMVEGLAKVWGRTLTGEATKVWYRALKEFSRQTVSAACSHASMNETRFPTPAKLQEIIRELRHAGDKKRYRPMPLADIQPGTEYGSCCLDIINAVSAGQLSRVQGVQSTFHAATELGVDLWKNLSYREAQRLDALKSKYQEG